MKPHVTELLDAYFDGELAVSRKRQVEKHLLDCESCRAELESLGKLSSLLKADAAPNQNSTARFIANLTLNLPRQPARFQSRGALEIGWWFIPLGALGVWLFLQITFSLSSVVLTLSEAGLLGGGLSWMQSSSPDASWFSAAVNLLGGQLGPNSNFILSVLNDLSLFAHELTSRYVWQVLLATLYLGWLASGWLRRPAQAVPADSAPQS